ncbi:MAG: transcriptional regulator [Epsilonproteobacteria bacterium]|nr:transcriptional regulator [Campylobacterota bacterium]
MKKLIVFILISSIHLFAINIGEVPKEVTLSGENGGLVDGSEWNSSMLKGKVFVLFYVDPDKKDDNDKFIDALHQKGYDSSKYGSVAIINLKATWLPNFAIEKKLKAKQKEFPNTVYAKDKTKYLVNKWQLADDSANVLIFGKDGKLLYQHTGSMSSDEMQKAFEIIESHLND